MLEFSIARKYLTPKWRQLSVSIISLISILVIALVVWLIVVFFSVTYGLEKSWIGKLIALTAPVRVTPTDAYYRSYYYQVDGISQNSDYTAKTIGEKLQALDTDPYNSEIDEEPPATWPLPDKDEKEQVKDLVKLAFAAIDSISDIPGLSASDFEMTLANMRLQLVRHVDGYEQSTLQQTTYLGSFDQNNPALSKALIPLSMKDLSNIYEMLGFSSDSVQENDADLLKPAPRVQVQNELRAFFDLVAIQELQTTPPFWTLPKSLWPDTALMHAAILQKKEKWVRVVIPKDFKSFAPEGYKLIPCQIEFRNHIAYLLIKKGQPEQRVPDYLPISVEGHLPLTASLIPDSIERAIRPTAVQFKVAFRLQNVSFEGAVFYNNLAISKAEFKSAFPQNSQPNPPWLYRVSHQLILPSNLMMGDGILLPRPFRDAGVLVGDRGFLSYMTPTTSSVQEQRIPIFVAGFYDPGIIPIGGKYILANKEITSLIRSSHNQEDTMLSNGINVRFDHIEQADEVKRQLQKAFQKAGIAPYWRIETYREYDFTKDLIKQLHSEKNLFSLLAMIILVVACSNIISMLIILVNDKKTEIGILRSMGASSWTIALIFGWCGIVMGYVGSLIGILAAIITLKNLKPLIDLLSRLQGYEMFNPLYYGETLPGELSMKALGFVILATTCISCLSGLIPALKASLLRPSAILRSE